MADDPTGTREITAAIVREKGSFELGAALLEPPRADEVLVRIVATGLCHTDLVVRDQVYPVPLPIVLGHEGAGIVEAVGSAVTKVGPGDHVALSFLHCGQCRPCLDGSPASCANFNDINFAGQRPDGSHALSLANGGATLHDRFFAQSSFATFAIAHEANTVKVRDDAPLELLGPLGCGIQTGAGTVLRALRVGAGASFAVTGAGAVGLSAVMAARAAGATTIIAVDVLPARLDLARELGATHVDQRREDRCRRRDPADHRRRGVDYALDTTGLPALIEQGVEALRQRGTAAILGASTTRRGDSASSQRVHAELQDAHGGRGGQQRARRGDPTAARPAHARPIPFRPARTLLRLRPDQPSCR